MKAVYKYEITGDEMVVETFEDWKFLHIGLQDGKPYVWLSVNTANDRVGERMRFFATGEEIDDQWEVLGTVQVGALVFHLAHDDNEYEWFGTPDDEEDDDDDDVIEDDEDENE